MVRGWSEGPPSSKSFTYSTVGEKADQIKNIPWFRRKSSLNEHGQKWATI